MRRRIHYASQQNVSHVIVSGRRDGFAPDIAGEIGVQNFTTHWARTVL